MNESYLKLQGWIPHRLVLGGDVGLFLYNPTKGIIINKRGILHNEFIDDESYRIVDMKIVSFAEIPENIIEEAINLALG